MSTSLLKIDSVCLRESWRSCDIDPWLRVVVVVASTLYAEQGATCCRLLSIGDKGTYGRIAKLSVLELPGVRISSRSEYHKTPAWICSRINVLFPFGDGDKETAVYNGISMKIEVPFYGYCKKCLALRDWPEWGAKKSSMRPKRIRLIEPEIVVGAPTRG